MNEIERSKFTIEEYDIALNSIIPPVIAQDVESAIQYKDLMIRNVNLTDIINKANILYIQQHVVPYFDFFLKYLETSGEKGEIITVDNGTLFVFSTGIENNKTTEQIRYCLNMSDYYFGVNAAAWLKIYRPKSIEFERVIRAYWSYSPLEVDSEQDIYIKLLPADTVLHLHELYKIMSFYL